MREGDIKNTHEKDIGDQRKEVWGWRLEEESECMWVKCMNKISKN